MSRNSSLVLNNAMETIQWFVFLLANAVALPIVIGAIFELNFVEISELMQRTFFVVGLASLLQGWIGHRLPIMEGPAGLWISIFTVMAYTGVHAGDSYREVLQVLQGTMIWTGIFLLLFGLFRLSHRVLFVFTPFVTGAFLFLLTVQLSGTFLQGMLGIDGGEQQIESTGAIIAFVTVLLVLGLSIAGRGWVKSFAVLIGIVMGWVLYVIVAGGGSGGGQAGGGFSLPEVFAWGAPVFSLNTIPLAFMIAVILLSNLVASVVAVTETIHGKATYTYEQINRGSSFMGINHGLAALFSAIANVSMASSSGFMQLTGQKRKAPFLYAAALLILVSFFPPIVAFISGIPKPVANAALLATFIQLMGLGLSNMTSERLDERRLMILGISFSIGIGLMFLPSSVFAGMPAMAQNLLSNGLLVGTILVILLDQLWKESNRTA
ncbi:UNVERIFIED_CONTAM: purine/pyrimidine permease [Halobacillus marinus]|uniref:purine/pyrimidine permease n=1 Tax=unclassified Halobacillus TaxID=2636472 RepID=UPI0002A5024D|nr:MULTISPECIES: purine/pyrimidine permease [unclassified Halobacillus]ELK46752.1 xanthine/uracil permease family protein [Halobacillus sp. BAB-2008]